jgi:hypothetical protein
MRLSFIPAVLAAASFMSACTSVAQSTRLSTGLQAAEFNSLMSSYQPRPTSVSLETMSDGVEVLAIEMDQYGTTRFDYGYEVHHQFRMLPEAIGDYVALIDQYDRWRELASERGDAITREIGRAPAWHGELKFEFHSGNSDRHYLLLAICAVGTCLDDQALAFDADNAARLRDVLYRWQAGELTVLDVNDIYN